MLVVLFVIMSSKKNSRKRLCPGSKLAAPAHFGLLNKFCTRPGRKESEDGAEVIDTAKVSPISLVHNATLSNQLLNYYKQLDCSLTTEIGKILPERTALKDEITHPARDLASPLAATTKQQHPASHFHQVIMNKYIYQGF